MPQNENDLDVGRVKVMVVDRNRYVRQILRNIVMGFGVRDVRSASDGIEAIKEFQNFSADIIFTGYFMKPMNGLVLTQAVRSGKAHVEPEVPIVMVSSHTDAELIIQARDAGVTEFLAKPVSSKLVWLRLKAVIAHPRPFVKAPNFFGPDRRRREIQRSGQERRERPYLYTAAMRRAMRREDQA